MMPLMNKPIYIRGGRVVDPLAGRNETADLFVQDGLIAPLPPSPPPGAEIFEAHGCVVAPGFIDLHVHLREPGGEEAETIESGSRAAARGGFTQVVAMPNTRPPTDTAERVSFVKQRGDAAGMARVIPSGCITAGREGRDLTPVAALVAAGARALTDDGSTVMSDTLMQQAMRLAWEFGVVVMDHAQDRNSEAKGVMHEGDFSRRWQLPGIPAEAEVSVIRRDIDLARRTGCALHIQHVSTAAGCDLIREARALGLRVSGEATPHHLALCDADVDPANTCFKMNPPLRSPADREALLHAISDGTLTALATDHAPHTAASKARGFLDAPFGVVGLETAVGVTYTQLVKSGLMSLSDWVERWTLGPARILGLNEPTLKPGTIADVVVLDLKTEWVVRSDAFLSRSRNTPFEGAVLTGRAVRTLLGGKTVWLQGRE